MGQRGPGLGMAGSSEPQRGRESCLRLGSWPEAHKVASPGPCNGQWLWKRRPLRSGHCGGPASLLSGEELKRFLASCILRSFSLPFKPSVAPWPPPEQHGTQAACSCPMPHSSLSGMGGPQRSKRPQRVTFPSLPWLGLPQRILGKHNTAQVGKGDQSPHFPLEGGVSGSWG